MISHSATLLIDNLRANGANYDKKQRRVSLERISTKLDKRRQSLPVLPSYIILSNQTTERRRRKGVTFPLGVLMQQAVTDGDLQAIKELIATHGPKAVEERDPNGLPPVNRAIFEDQLDSLKLLLDAGADVSVRDPEDWSPLHVASAMDDCEAAGLILHAAGKQCDLTSMDNVDGERPIDMADSLEMANLLLQADLAEQRLQPNRSNAGSVSHQAKVLMLVKNHYEKNSDSTELNSILKANTSYTSLLHLAASKNYPHLLDYVCRNQLSSIEIRNKDGWTPLHTAAYYNSLDVAMLLVEQGANIHALTHNYEKPSDLAQHLLILALLEDHHAF